MEQLSGRVKSFCNCCAGETWHNVLHAAEQRFVEDNSVERYVYYTLQCGGCDTVKLREDWNMTGMGDDVSTTSYPPPAYRKTPDWITQWWRSTEVKNSTLRIGREVYKALQNDQPHLAAMGVRAVLEQATIDKIGGDQGSFDDKLAALYAQGHVSLLMQQRLKSVLDVGSAAIHRGYTPSQEDLTTLVDIMEHVMESLYLHDADVKRMAERTPRRPPVVKKPASGDR